MGIRIAHISDTHLGTKPREGVKPGVWGVEMRAQLLENDFYERFSELFDRIASLNPPVNLVIHSGDLYDSPWELNPQHPPTFAEQTAVSVMKSFIERTGIPILILEGNHGLYRNLEVSLLDLLHMTVPHLDVATNVQLKEALAKGQPLKFTYGQLDVFCFPFMEPSVLESSKLVAKFNDWVTTFQGPKSSRLSVAVAHGMIQDKSLFPNVLSMGYDYVALGHDHHQHKHSENAWYAGSSERWRFDESSHRKGFLVVDVKKGSAPVVTPQYIDYARPVKNERMTVDPADTPESLERKVLDWFAANGLRTEWKPETAARVRLMFEGNSTRVGRMDLNIMLESMRVKMLSDGSGFNVAQFVWDARQAEKERDVTAYPEIVTDYLIEDPHEDFRKFLEASKIDPGLDTKTLTQIAVKAMQMAVKREGETMSLDNYSEESAP